MIIFTSDASHCALDSQIAVMATLSFFPQSPTSKEVVMAALEKAKPNLPAKPVKQKAPSKAAASSAATYDDNDVADDDEPAEKPAAKAAAKPKSAF